MARTSYLSSYKKYLAYKIFFMELVLQNVVLFNAIYRSNISTTV